MLTMPNLNARCQRMSYTGNRDRVLLEGDVHILSEKNGEVTRIDAPRISVDLIHGTFTVESSQGPSPANVDPNVGLRQQPVPALEGNAVPRSPAPPFSEEQWQGGQWQGGIGERVRFRY